MSLDVSDAHPVEGITPGSNVLVCGPPMTGKFELMFQLLAEATDGLVVVTTKNTPEEVATQNDAVAGGVLGVVDCVGQGDLSTVEESIDSKDGPPFVYTATPRNLTGIGVAFLDALDDVEDAGASTPGGGVHALSPLLMHADLARVYRFVGEISGQLRRRDGVGVFVLDTTADDDEVLGALEQHVDGVLHTRRAESGRELRGKGILGPSEWRRF